jgi:protein arginine kinase
VLKERHLISKELAEKGAGSGVMVSRDERIAVMVNEEDHLRIQGLFPGTDLHAIWEQLDALDSELEQDLDYAFSPRLGYLTACPTNVGTGLRASVIMHLCGLKLTHDLGPAINGLDKIGLSVRGLQGEGTEAFGNMFQISNQETLGETEVAIIDRLMRVVDEVVYHERNARARLLESKKQYMLDHIGRSLGLLLYCRVLPSGEAVDLLSGLRLGVECGIVKKISVSRLNELMLLSQPGHLQKMTGKRLSARARDELRASIAREKLRNAVLVT